LGLNFDVGAAADTVHIAVSNELPLTEHVRRDNEFKLLRANHVLDPDLADVNGGGRYGHIPGGHLSNTSYGTPGLIPGRILSLGPPSRGRRCLRRHRSTGNA